MSVRTNINVLPHNYAISMQKKTGKIPFSPLNVETSPSFKTKRKAARIVFYNKILATLKAANR